jgi:hypothetical protein
MPKLNKVNSPREVPIAGSATLNQGQLYVNGDTGQPFVAQTTDTAANIATSLGIVSNITTIDMNARVGAFPSDGGTNIFETNG